jgi:predicted DNA-binding transcriptional regulator AlpA
MPPRWPAVSLRAGGRRSCNRYQSGKFVRGGAAVTIATTVSCNSDHQQPPILVDVKEVARMTFLSVRMVWRLTSSGEFPQPVRIGTATRWRFEDVKEWADNLV